MVSKPILKSFQKNPKSTPKQSETAPKIIRKTISKSHKNHPKSVPEVSRCDPCQALKCHFLILVGFILILWKKEVRLGTPFFKFSVPWIPKTRPMIIGGHLLAPLGGLEGASGHFGTCLKSAPERSPYILLA